MLESIPAKTIVSGYRKNNRWFGMHYNMNIYKGCCHGCIYCDSRSDCYRVDDFDLSLIHILYDEERTFADYIRESAVSQVTEVYVLYSEAQANGYDYENDVYAQALYQSSMSQLQESAETYEMEPEALLKAIYSNQMKMSDFEAFLTRRTTAQGYAEQLESGLTVSDDEAENYYSENKDEYDNVSYRYFTFPYETVTYTEPEDGETPEEGAPTSEEEATAMTEENRAAAEALANEMLERITDEQSFIDLALEYADEEDKEEYSDDDATLVTNGSATATSPLAQWYSCLLYTSRCV